MKLKTWILLVLLFGLTMTGSAFAQEYPPPNPDRVRSIDWSPDGSKIAYSANNGLTKIIDAATAQDILTIHSDEEGPTISIDWSPDGTALATGGVDKVMRIWDVKTGQLLHFEETKYADYVTAVSWSPDSSKIARSSSSGAIDVWDTSSWKLLFDLVGGDSSLDWNADGSELAVSGGLGIEIWNANTGQLITNFSGYSASIISIDWSIQNELVIGGLNPIINVWDMTTNRLLTTIDISNEQQNLFLNVVNSVAWNPAGTLIASAWDDGTIRIWNNTTGELFQLIQEDAPMFAAAWSLDGSKIAYGGDNNTIKIVDVPPKPAPQPDITAVAWSPDGTRIVEGSSDGFLRVWDSSGQPLLDLKGVTGTTRSVDWSPDSAKIVSGGDDKMIRVWDADNGMLLATLKGHEDVIQSVDWSPDGTKIASIGFDEQYSLRIWDANNYQLLAFTDAGPSYRVQWSPDSKYLVTAPQSGYALVYTEKLDQLWNLPSVDGTIAGIDWNQDGSKIIASDTDGQILLWDFKNKSEILRIQAGNDALLTIHWSPDNQYFASASIDSLVIWESATNTSLITLRIPQDVHLFSIAWSPDSGQIAYGDSNHTIKIVDVVTTPPPEPTIIALSWSPDGTRIVTGGTFGFLRIWDASGEPLMDLKGISGAINSVDWSADSSKIVTSSDPSIWIWDANTGETLAHLTDHAEYLQSVDWSPDGTKIASTTYYDPDSLQLWDAMTFQLIKSTHAGQAFETRWSPDGNFLAVAGAGGSLLLYDSQLNQLKRPAPIEEGLICTDWSPDGSKIVAGSGKGQLYIWDFETKEMVTTFLAHSDFVDAVRWSPDNRYIATASRDGDLKIWDTETYKLVVTFPVPKDNYLWSIAWSPDSRQIAYGDSNRTLKIVDVPTVEITPASP